MNLDFTLPALGENIENGEIVNVLVREGDQIAANQPVLELETDKAVLEIPCPHAGRVTKVHIAKGDTVAVGQTLISVESEAAEATDSSPGATGSLPASGDESPIPGATGSLAAGPGETPATPAATGSVPAATSESPTPSLPADQPSPTAPCPIPAGPATRRLARELNVELAQVSGTGPRGRITSDDVRAAAAPQPPTPPGEPDQDKWGPIRRERLSKIRRTIAEQMVRSATTIPHVTNFDDADLTQLEHLRKGVPPDYLGQGIKLTAMPFVLRAVALALGYHPLLNASIDEENQQIIYKQYVNIGIAVDTPRGLVVPAARNVDRMSIPQIARELKTLAQRARAAEFSVEDLRGGTFTISNLGAVGGTYSTPIINHPEVAILLLGRSRWMPVVRDQNIETRLMMPLSLSYDHRLVDGAAAGRFLNQVIDYLQFPGRLLLTPGP